MAQKSLILDKRPAPLKFAFGSPLSALVLPVSDAAKSENTPEDMTVYTSLESPINLTVKFCLNPVDNYDVYWSMGGLELQDANVRNTAKEEHIQTTYFISNVTNKHLGKYRVQVINWAIDSEHNDVIFNVTLKLRGKDSKFMSILQVYVCCIACY